MAVSDTCKRRETKMTRVKRKSNFFKKKKSPVASVSPISPYSPHFSDTVKGRGEGRGEPPLHTSHIGAGEDAYVCVTGFSQCILNR